MKNPNDNFKQSWLDKPHCMNCGCTSFKNRYRDYLDCHTLLESQDDCTNCGKPVYFFAYGSIEDYTFTIRQLLQNLAI